MLWITLLAKSVTEERDQGEKPAASTGQFCDGFSEGKSSLTIVLYTRING